MILCFFLTQDILTTVEACTEDTTEGATDINLLFFVLKQFIQMNKPHLYDAHSQIY